MKRKGAGWLSVFVLVLLVAAGNGCSPVYYDAGSAYIPITPLVPQRDSTVQWRHNLYANFGFHSGYNDSEYSLSDSVQLGIRDGGRQIGFHYQSVLAVEWWFCSADVGYSYGEYSIGFAPYGTYRYQGMRLDIGTGMRLGRRSGDWQAILGMGLHYHTETGPYVNLLRSWERNPPFSIIEVSIGSNRLTPYLWAGLSGGDDDLRAQVDLVVGSQQFHTGMNGHLLLRNRYLIGAGISTLWLGTEGASAHLRIGYQLPFRRKRTAAKTG